MNYSKVLNHYNTTGNFNSLRSLAFKTYHELLNKEVELAFILEKTIYNYSITEYYNDIYRKNIADNNSSVRMFMRTKSLKKTETTNEERQQNIFKNKYSAYVRHMKYNLKVEGETSLRRKLLSGEVMPDRVLKMHPSSYHTKNDVKKPEKFKSDKDIPDGILKCPKCKSYKTEYVELFTRKADEASTKKCYCFVCGKRWRFS
jgi:DNA-directed RNA polymerase subunit M/transcription elongation factor TFIIS